MASCHHETGENCTDDDETTNDDNHFATIAKVIFGQVCLVITSSSFSSQPMTRLFGMANRWAFPWVPFRWRELCWRRLPIQPARSTSGKAA